MYDMITGLFFSLQDNSSYPLIGAIYPFPIHKFDKQLIKNINLFCVVLSFKFWKLFLWV